MMQAIKNKDVLVALLPWTKKVRNLSFFKHVHFYKRKQTSLKTLFEISSNLVVSSAKSKSAVELHVEKSAKNKQLFYSKAVDSFFSEN